MIECRNLKDMLAAKSVENSAEPSVTSAEIFAGYINTLKPCPSCKGFAVVYTGHYGGGKTYRMQCSSCGIDTRESELKSSVIEAWNRRVQA